MAVVTSTKYMIYAIQRSIEAKDEAMLKEGLIDEPWPLAMIQHYSPQFVAHNTELVR
jgi:hypothetical protein